MLSFAINEHFQRVERAERSMKDDAHSTTRRYQRCRSVVDVAVKLIVH